MGFTSTIYSDGPRALWNKLPSTSPSSTSRPQRTLFFHNSWLLVMVDEMPRNLFERLTRDGSALLHPMQVLAPIELLRIDAAPSQTTQDGHGVSKHGFLTLALGFQTAHLYLERVRGVHGVYLQMVACESFVAQRAFEHVGSEFPCLEEPVMLLPCFRLVRVVEFPEHLHPAQTTAYVGQAVLARSPGINQHLDYRRPCAAFKVFCSEGPAQNSNFGGTTVQGLWPTPEFSIECLKP